MNLPEHQHPKPYLHGPIDYPFPAGKENYVRLRQGGTAHYDLDIPKDLAEMELNTYGNLPEGQPQINDSGTTYPSIDFSALEPGSYHFKLRYTSQTSGEQYVDSRGYTHLMVDPERLNNIRLYTFIPNVSGTIDDWIDDLDRIANMGFNMIHMLPITPMDQSESPYSAYDYFGVDDRYIGPKKQGLQEFVAKAKSLRLGLCFDLVLNHIGFTSKMAQQCPEWIQSDPNEKNGLKRAGCWAGDGWLTWNDLVLINFDHPNPETRKQIWDYMTEVVLFWGKWANETHGMIRLDNLHSTHQGFLSHAMDELHKAYPNLIVLGELFASPEDQNRMILDHQLHLLLATPWDKDYVPDLRSQVQYLHDVFPKMKFILPISSHDSGTPTQEFYDVRATIPRYAVSALLNCGATGMCQGVEYGAPQKIEFIGFQGKLEITGPKNFEDQITELNALMEQHDVLKQGGNLTFIDKGHGAILGAYRHSHDSKNPHLLILINMDMHHRQPIEISPDSVSLFEGDQSQPIFGAPKGNTGIDIPTNISLAPCGVIVYEIKR
jgi:hypothetical protein